MTKEKMVEELLEQFVLLSVAQDDALALREMTRFNRLFDKKHAIIDALKARDGDQRRALLMLYDHPNMQVRLNAAEATFEVVPDRARKALEAIARSQHFPQAGYAGMSLRIVDRGLATS